MPRRAEEACEGCEKSPVCVSAENSVRVNVRAGMAALGLAFTLYSLTNEPFHVLVLRLGSSPRAGMSVCFVHWYNVTLWEGTVDQTSNSAHSTSL